jgi:hypothetical protein
MAGVPNEEIIAGMREKENEEKAKLDAEKKLKKEEERKKIEELKNRAFEVMRQNGVLSEEDMPENKVEEKVNAEKTENDSQTSSVAGSEQDGSNKDDGSDAK